MIPASTSEKALLFVDSRYWIQAEKEVVRDVWTVVKVGSSGGGGRDAVVGGWVDWAVKVCSPGYRALLHRHGADQVFQSARGSRIGIDPKFVSLSELAQPCRGSA